MDRGEKTVGESQTQMTELALPGDSNPLGNILGGRVMHWIDLAAAMAAMRHAGQVAVTASMDRVEFLSPIKVGHVVHLTARLTWVGRTSMEVRVDVESEDMVSGEHNITSTAYLTFVAIGSDGRPVPVPRLVPSSPQEAEEFHAAERRQAERVNNRKMSDRAP